MPLSLSLNGSLCATPQAYIRFTSKKDGAAWFKSSSNERLGSPPDLTARPDLEDGDLFFHQLPNGRQMWIWKADSTGTMHWKAVKEGHTRADGRRLSIQPMRSQPSWISEIWYIKKLRDAEKKKKEAQKKK